MSWAIEEYAEDAIAAYLTAKVDSDLLAVYTAWTNTEIKYPCAVVHAGTSGNVGATGFTGMRTIGASIAVMTEAADTTTQTARERNRAARDDVIDALAQTALHDDINAMNPKGIVFSLARIEDITRSVDEGRRVFVSEIGMTCIASPLAVK
jgi:hypothetical protein